MWAPLRARSSSQIRSGPIWLRRSTAITVAESAGISRAASVRRPGGPRWSVAPGGSREIISLALGTGELIPKHTQKRGGDRAELVHSGRAGYSTFYEGRSGSMASRPGGRLAIATRVPFTPGTERRVRTPHQLALLNRNWPTSPESAATDEPDLVPFQKSEPVYESFSRVRNSWAPSSSLGLSPRVSPEPYEPFGPAGVRVQRNGNGGSSEESASRSVGFAGGRETPISTGFPDSDTRRVGQLALDETELSDWLNRNIADALWSAHGGTTGPDSRISPPAPGTPLYL